MASDDFDSDKIIWYWKTEASEAIEVANHLIEKEDYSYALFFGHLAIEKILKALYAKRHKKHAPPIHNLVRLARECELALDDNQIEKLLTVTSFNLEARYPDIKREFRKKCTRQFASENMAHIVEVMKWLQKMI